MQMDETVLLHAYIGKGRKGAVMIDVGGHIGGSSHPFLEDGWCVYAFEPDRDNRAVLRQLADKYPAFSIDPRAVADRSQKRVPFFRSSVSSGISGLHAFHSSHVSSGRVDVVSLTDYCAKQNISRVDFLKIDTEGYDLFVLRGFPWERFRPDFVECEFEDRKTTALGYKIGDMAAYLVEKGYYVMVSEWKPIVEYGRSHTWQGFKSWPCVLECADAWGNLLAFKEPPDTARLLNALSKEMVKSHGVQASPQPAKYNQSGALRSYLKTRWRCLNIEGMLRVYIFGAGKFTRWLLRAVAGHPGPSVLGIIDEVKGGTFFSDIPCIAPADANMRVCDGIVLGTDLSREKFSARCRELFGADVKIIDLFDAFEGEIPLFEKE